MKKNNYKTGFKVPESYFEGVEARIFDKLLEGQLPKDSGFKVPDGYFEGLEDRLSLEKNAAHWKVYSGNRQRKQHLYSNPLVYAIVGMAAVLTIVLTVYPFGKNNSFTFDDLNASTIAAYIQDGELDFTSDDLATYLVDEDFDALVVPSGELSEENLSEYLLNNLEDNTLLLE